MSNWKTTAAVVTVFMALSGAAQATGSKSKPKPMPPAGNGDLTANQNVDINNRVGVHNNVGVNNRVGVDVTANPEANANADANANAVGVGHGGQGGAGGEGGAASADANANNGDQSLTNNISHRSRYTGAAATNVASAYNFVAKDCVSSLGFGVSGGIVTGGYGGISFSYTPSGAVEITMEDKDGIKYHYSVPELADLTPQKRGEILGDMDSGDRALASCLMSKSVEAERDRKNALQIEAIRAQGSVDTARVEAAGEVAVTGMRHLCNLDVNPDVPESVARRREVSPTMANTEHGACETNTEKALDFILQGPSN